MEFFISLTDDMVLEVNGQKIYSLETLNALLAVHSGKMILGVVPVEGRGGASDMRGTSQGSRVRKARDFFAKVCLHILIRVQVILRNHS